MRQHRGRAEVEARVRQHRGRAEVEARVRQHRGRAEVEARVRQHRGRAEVEARMRQHRGRAEVEARLRRAQRWRCDLCVTTAPEIPDSSWRSQLSCLLWFLAGRPVFPTDSGKKVAGMWTSCRHQASPDSPAFAALGLKEAERSWKKKTLPNVHPATTSAT